MHRSYFESMYESDDDPWGFESSFYERRKYELTIASLTRPRYRSAFEPGCSNGALTERLAARCDQLVATDIIPATVERARHRTAHLPHVQIAEQQFPAGWPDGPQDLVVWSEVAYYLGDTSLDDAVDSLDRHLAAGGDLIVVNYTGPTNYPQTAGSVDARIERSGLVQRHTTIKSERFRLDVWRRIAASDPASRSSRHDVAEDGGSTN